MGACIARNTSIAYISTINGGIAKTDLASSPPTWTIVSIPLQETVNDVVFVNATKGYAVGNIRTAFMTTDGGASWSDVSTTTGPHLRAVDSWGNGDEALAVGENGTLLKKSSASGKFRKLYSSPPTLDHLNDIQAVLGGAAYFAVGDNGVVIHGTDGSWVLPKSQTGQHLVSCSFDSAEHGFVFGRRFGIIEYD